MFFKKKEPQIPNDEKELYAIIVDAIHKERVTEHNFTPVWDAYNMGTWSHGPIKLNLYEGYNLEISVSVEIAGKKIKLSDYTSEKIGELLYSHYSAFRTEEIRKQKEREEQDLKEATALLSKTLGPV